MCAHVGACVRVCVCDRRERGMRGGKEEKRKEEERGKLRERETNYLNLNT